MPIGTYVRTPFRLFFYFYSPALAHVLRHIKGILFSGNGRPYILGRAITLPNAKDIPHGRAWFLAGVILQAPATLNLDASLDLAPGHSLPGHFIPGSERVASVVSK
jgi:hypothetical protein